MALLNKRTQLIGGGCVEMECQESLWFSETQTDSAPEFNVQC